MAWGPLNGLPPTRIDDLISFGIVLLELNNVTFPWMNKISDDEDIETAMEIVRNDWKNVTIEVELLNRDFVENSDLIFILRNFVKNPMIRNFFWNISTF